MTEPSTAMTAPPVAPARGGGLGRMFATAMALIAGVALALLAALVALIGVLAAVALLLVRRPRAATGPVTLEGRRTAEGWVAETASR